MKNKNIFFCSAAAVFLVFFVFVSTSCEIIKDRTDTGANENEKTVENSKKTSGGVISLFDSIGVGDVSLYPGYVYDEELNS
ncbi:MAG: hypothetical protein WCJ54_06775, partial [Actinomycetota bacterium]